MTSFQLRGYLVPASTRELRKLSIFTAYGECFHFRSEEFPQNFSAVNDGASKEANIYRCTRDEKWNQMKCNQKPI